jgi:hypothetical protein
MDHSVRLGIKYTEELAWWKTFIKLYYKANVISPMMAPIFVVRLCGGCLSISHIYLENSMLGLQLGQNEVD